MHTPSNTEKMPNLALLILITVFLTQSVSWIGKSVLQNLAFETYSRIFLSSKSKQQRVLRKQVLQDKAELARTSSQDEFAKWARLRRKVDKSLADLEKISMFPFRHTSGLIQQGWIMGSNFGKMLMVDTTLASSQNGFKTKFSSFLWITTTGSQMFLVWWYKSKPVFWLPKGWFPSIIVWILSFPSAPLGMSPFFVVPYTSLFPSESYG
jgi:hypothetical protein